MSKEEDIVFIQARVSSTSTSATILILILAFSFRSLDIHFAVLTIRFPLFWVVHSTYVSQYRNPHQEAIYIDPTTSTTQIPSLATDAYQSPIARNATQQPTEFFQEIGPLVSPHQTLSNTPFPTTHSASTPRPFVSTRTTKLNL